MTTNFLEKIKQTDNFILFIYFYFFIMPWNFEKWQMGALTVIMFIWWIIKYKSQLKEKLKILFEFKPLVILIAFIAYTYISSLWSESIMDGFEYVNSYHKYYFLFIPVLFTSLNSDQAKNSIKILLFSFFVYSIFSILIYLGLFTIDSTNSNVYNPKGLMGYAIVTQYMSIGSLALFILALFETNKKNKILLFILSLVCFFALFVNNSRTAQLSLFLSILSILVITFKFKSLKLKKTIIIFISILLLVFSGFYLVQKTNKLDRYLVAFTEFVKVIEEDKYEGSLGLRIYFNKVGFDGLKQHPVFGFGPEDNIVYLEEYQKNDPNYTYEKIFSTYHSEHFDLITRFGLVGYFLLVFSIIYLLILLKKLDYKYYLVGLSMYVPIAFISLANATFAKKPINYILISVFILLSVIVYNHIKETNNVNSSTK